MACNSSALNCGFFHTFHNIVDLLHPAGADQGRGNHLVAQHPGNPSCAMLWPRALAISFYLRTMATFGSVAWSGRRKLYGFGARD